MNFKKTMFALAIGSVGIMGAMSAHAVALNNGDVLTIDAGGGGYGIGAATGSFFVMDLDGDSKAQWANIIKLSQGTTGITIGALGGAGNAHAGPPVGADANSGAIFDSWLFNGSTGTNYVSGTPITGSTGTNGINMGGWFVNWSTVTGIPMNTGAWNMQGTLSSAGGYTGTITGTTNGMANFSWDGVYGNAYTLDYTATVPAGDASGFGGTQYALHLTGTVNPVPEASTYGMMLAGLGLVGFAVRRRKLMA